MICKAWHTEGIGKPAERADKMWIHVNDGVPDGTGIMERPFFANVYPQNQPARFATEHERNAYVEGVLNEHGDMDIVEGWI